MLIKHYSFVILLFLFFPGKVAADILYEPSPYNPQMYSDSSSPSYDQGDVNQAYQEPQQPRRKQVIRTTTRTVTSRVRMPQQITSSGEKVIIVDPRVHAWGAYSSQGKLIRSGMASAGANWCPDLKRPCRTSSGTFRIYSLGDSDCYSKRFPLGEGGAPMPYCMYFNGGQGLHGSHEVGPRNMSHGCVRLHVGDAEWIRYNFAKVGTKVMVRSY